MLYIQALGNIKISPVSTYLEPIIRGKLNYPRQLRFQAIWAASDELLQDPEKVNFARSLNKLILSYFGLVPDS